MVSDSFHGCRMSLPTRIPPQQAEPIRDDTVRHDRASHMTFICGRLFPDTRLVHPQDARIPFMVLDGLVVLGLNLWDNHLKAQKEKATHEEDVEHETDKKASRATKSISRQQRKAEDLKLKHAAKGPISFAPKQNINQPKKNM